MREGGSLFSCAIFQGAQQATRRPHLRLARGGTDSVCLCVRRYLHHAPTSPHTQPPNHTNPCTPQYFTPTSLATTPHSHLSFGYKQLVWGIPLGLASVFAKDNTTLHIHTIHFINNRKHPTPTLLGNILKRALVVPSSSPHQRAFVYGACSGTAQVGVSFLSTLYMV